MASTYQVTGSSISLRRLLASFERLSGPSTMNMVSFAPIKRIKGFRSLSASQGFIVKGATTKSSSQIVDSKYAITKVEFENMSLHSRRKAYRPEPIYRLYELPPDYMHWQPLPMTPYDKHLPVPLLYYPHKMPCYPLPLPNYHDEMHRCPKHYDPEELIAARKEKIAAFMASRGLLLEDANKDNPSDGTKNHAGQE